MNTLNNWITGKWELVNHLNDRMTRKWDLMKHEYFE